MKGVDQRQKEAMARAVKQNQAKDQGFEDKALLQELKKTMGAEQNLILQNYLRKSAVEALNMEANELAASELLLDVGMDSLAGYEFKTKIEKALEIRNEGLGGNYLGIL